MAAARKRDQKVPFPPRTSSQRHSSAFFGRNGPLRHHVAEHGVGFIHNILEPGRAVISESRKHNDQAPARTQFSRTQRKEGLPVLRRVTVEFCAHHSCTAEWYEVTRNQRGHSAKPHCRIRAPSQMYRTRRQHVLVE